MKQYRVKVAANFREEEYITSKVRAVLAAGTIVNIDDERIPKGDWLPVLLVRGWMHKSVLEPIE